MSPTPHFGPLALGVLAAWAGTAQAQVWRVHDPHVLGAAMDLTAIAPDPAVALAATRAARAEIARLDAILSRWRPDSALSALNAGIATPASPELHDAIAAADRWRAQTDGAFDARLDGRLDLDGIAKGQVIDSALAAARCAAPGLEGLMLDIGGDLKVWGRAPGEGGWRVGISDPAWLQDNAEPAQVLRLIDRAVAFSGPGLRGDHIRIPATGQPARRISAAVVADSARDADALSTALCVMTPERGIALADRLERVEALVMDETGRRFPSRGWNALLDPPSAPARLIRAQAAAPWPPGFQVTLNYEIPQIQRARAQSPYVVVWVTNAEGSAVRTLMLLGDDTRFIDQNFIWWRKVGRLAARVDAMAKPTRRPGRYSLVWDGRDDHGAPVNQGRYTLHVEAIREHGGHAYQTFDFVLGAAPVEATAAAQDEIGAATVRYGPHP